MSKFARFREYAKAYYSPFYGPMMLLFCFLLVNQAVAVASPYIFGRIVDAIISKESIQVALGFVLGLLGLSVLEKLLNYTQGILEIKRLDYDVARHISRSSLEKLLKLSFGQHVGEHSGLMQAILKQGEGALKNMVNNIIYVLLPLVLQVVVITIVLLWMSPIIGALLSFGILLFVGLAYMTNRKFMGRIKDVQEMNRQVERRYSEVLRNFPLIKVTGREADSLSDWEARRLSADTFAKSVWTRYSLFAEARFVLADVVKCAVIAMGVYLVYRGLHTTGELVTVLGWSSSAFAQLNRVGSLQRRIVEDIGNIDKYVEVVSQDPAVKESQNAVTLKYIRGDIVFHQVHFAYPSDVKNGKSVRETLTDVSFTIHAGETVALVGQSGAGKTTIVNLLLRGYDPTDGQITIDGHDLRNISLSAYCEQIGYVQQQVPLFDDTLRFNILCGLPVEKHAEALERLEMVAKDACIDRFFDRLGADKFGTVVGERGVRLSGGEQQRVGIARALIKNPRILIFDEATSNLDADSESVIHEATKRALKGRTGIIIAHRLSTVVEADRIIVVERGRIADIGTHKELLGRSLNYKSLVEKQIRALGSL